MSNIASNTSTVVGLFQGVNDELMFGWFGIFMLIGICFVLFTSYYFSTGDIKKSLVATAFVSFGLSVLLQALALVPLKVLFITLIFSAITAALSWK